MKKRAIGLLVLTIMLMGCSGAKDTASAGNVSSEPYGVYARINKEENFAGQDVLEEEFLYSLHEDGTGLVRCHDDFAIEWDDKNIYWLVPSPEGREAHEYKLEGNVLKVHDADGWNEYTKKPGDDIVQNGDMTEFVGMYTATEETISTYGKEQMLPDFRFSWAGNIANGVDHIQTWPDKVTKNKDGSYLCEYDDYDFEYTVYPEGVVDKKDKDNAELKDKVYIRVVNGKGDEAKETVYYRYANF